MKMNMGSLKSGILSLHNDENGQDLIEYALVAALIGLGSITAMKTLSNFIFNTVERAILGAP
jgi:pilus assembly protein Flp/PilA